MWKRALWVAGVCLGFGLGLGLGGTGPATADPADGSIWDRAYTGKGYNGGWPCPDGLGDLTVSGIRHLYHCPGSNCHVGERPDDSSYWQLIGRCE